MNDMYPMIGGRRLICNSKIDPLRDPCAVILDTNVIKDIGAFYFGSRLINQDLKKDSSVYSHSMSLYSFNNRNSRPLLSTWIERALIKTRW